MNKKDLILMVARHASGNRLQKAVERILALDSIENDGGPGSGNWGHKGRAGKRGGSGKGTGGKKYRTGSKEEGFKRNEEARQLRSEGKEVPDPPKVEKAKNQEQAQRDPSRTIDPQTAGKNPGTSSGISPRNASEQWKKDLPQKQKEAVSYFASGEGKWINESLRSGKPLSKEDEEYTRDLDSAIESFGGIKKDTNIYSRIAPETVFHGSMSPDKLKRMLSNPKDINRAISELSGKAITEKGYTFGTTDEKTGEKQGNSPFVLDLKVPKGTPGAFVGSFDPNDINSCVLPRNTKFFINGVEVENGRGNAEYYKLKADVVPDQPNETSKHSPSANYSYSERSDGANYVKQSTAKGSKPKKPAQSRTGKKPRGRADPDPNNLPLMQYGSTRGRNDFSAGFTKAKLKEHYDGHKEEFDYIPSWKYHKMAKEFGSLPVGGDIVGGRDENGQIVRYDIKRNILFIGNPRSKRPITFMKPKFGSQNEMARGYEYAMGLIKYFD